MMDHSTDPLRALLIYGGFVYFDEELRVVQMNAFLPGGQGDLFLMFDLPRCCPAGLSQRLRKRWAEARLPEVLRAGGILRAWVMPEEAAEAPFGALAFILGHETLLFPLAG